MDDDSAMGFLAFAPTLGDVGGHDDGHDAPVCFTYATSVRHRRAARPSKMPCAADFRTRCRLSHRMDGVQPGSNRTSACACANVVCFANDGDHQPKRWWDAIAHCRRVSVDADQVCVSSELPVAIWISDDSMA